MNRKLTDQRRGCSQKLVFVDKAARETGKHIHIIDDAGFEALLHGRPAACKHL